MWVEAIGEDDIIHYVKASEIVEFWFSEGPKTTKLDVGRLNFKTKSGEVYRIFYPDPANPPVALWVQDNFKLIHFLDKHAPEDYTLSWEALCYPTNYLGEIAVVRAIELISWSQKKEFEEVLNTVCSNEKVFLSKHLKEALPLSLFGLGEVLLEDALKQSSALAIKPSLGTTGYVISDSKKILTVKKLLDQLRDVMSEFGTVLRKELGVRTGIRQVDDLYGKEE
jgi:hypothetical protein